MKPWMRLPASGAGQYPRRDNPAQASAQPGDGGLLCQVWRFRAYGRVELGALLAGLAMRVGELVADVATPWPLALVIDNVVRGTRPHGLLGALSGVLGVSAVAMLSVAAIGVLVTIAVSGMFDYLGDRIMNRAGERISAQIRTDVFAHLQRLPMAYHDHQSVGELTSRVSIDTDRIEDGLVKLFSILIPGVLSIAGFAVVLLTVNWRLGTIALCATPLMLATAVRYTRLTRISARRRRAAEGRQSGFVAESLHGIRTVHAFGRHDGHDHHFAVSNTQVLAAGLRAVELKARFTPLMELIGALGTAALLFAGGYGVLRGWWNVGILVVVTSYLRDMFKPMRGLAALSMTFAQAGASAERIAAIFTQPRPQPPPARALPARVLGDIELRQVALDYGRGAVLTNINLHVLPGQRIALLGHNGAGKSTLLALIAGLYPPSHGQILLDGIALQHQPDTWRHQQIAMVPQETFLFSGTIAANIAYARPEATDTDITAAARAALVTEFTDQLPDGLGTHIAAGGIGLSGGQRQRVGIARAILTQAPIVLLDEPTTGLDTTAEQLVITALAQLTAGRTVLMTTHRPALTRLATHTIELHNQTITDTPTTTTAVADTARCSQPCGTGERPRPRARTSP